MIPGFSGQLISESFLEGRIAAQLSAIDDQRFRRVLWDWRQSHALGPRSSLRALAERGAQPLVEALGFAWGGHVEPLNSAIAATLFSGSDAVLLLVAGWGEPLEPLWRTAVEQAAHRHASWCLLFNGPSIRLIDATRLYSRRHAHFDLDPAVEDERVFTALRIVLGNLTELRPLIGASERHAALVCESLRSGVLAASMEFLRALWSRPGRQPVAAAFEQSLTLVYRVLFLLFAEARGLVPMWHPVYRESYSVESLAELAQAGEEHGFWDALRAISRLAHAGCRAGDLSVAPFNGRLFAPARTPLADRRDLDDRAAQRAVAALTSRPSADGQASERVSYRDLGVEQLGAVYETLLDYEPRASAASVLLQPGSGIRKASGTFYTPQPIAQFLVRRTLRPLVEGLTADRILDLKILDPAMGSAAFLVAACGYLSSAYETALVEGGGYHPADFGASERSTIRRTIAERCLFGVDVNPMAVHLARLSLWLATLATERPLSFLDHHLVAGNSLLGAWLTNLRRPPGRAARTLSARGGELLPLFDEPLAELMRAALPMRFTLATAPSDTVGQIHEKERTLAALSHQDALLPRWKRVADLWCSHWFPSAAGRASPASAFGALSDRILSGRSALPDHIADAYLSEAASISARKRFFHWELEFPEAFFDVSGRPLEAPGFDAIVGNPPWDMIRADVGSSDQRSASRHDARAVLRFTRDSGVYRARSTGHANCYQLFVERAIALARPGGRIGLVVPWGLATDHGSASLRELLFSSCAVEELVGFENRRRVFPIHAGVRFLLLTATAGRPTTETACRFGECDPAVLETAADRGPRDDPWFSVRVAPSLLRRLSGDDLVVPHLQTPTDLGISERLAALFAPLGSAEGWGARFGRELNATADRGHFRSSGPGLAVVEGKAVTPFHVNVEGSTQRIAARDVARLLPGHRQQWRLAYRDVASATNRQTVIAALLPPGCISTHTLFCLKTNLSLPTQFALCGLLNSFVVNYLARLRVTTHVTTAIVERLPVPSACQASRALAEIGAMARLLTRGANRSVLATLNGRAAQVYQLTRDEFAHVLSTFPLVPTEERNDALAEFSSS